MNICIVTVYDSINSGSYWQAWALGQVLKKMGNDVYYYKREKSGASSSHRVQAIQLTKYLMKFCFVDAYYYLKRIQKFNQLSMQFSVITSKDPVYKDIDVFILGSDTIWNLEASYFRRHKAIFWGDIFQKGKIISYAGSIANTRVDIILQNKDYSESVKRWAAVSVRDKYTKQIFEKLTDKNVTLVCDPTFLLEASDYEKVYKPMTGNYIFLYLFTPLSRIQSKMLHTFATERSLKIICSAGQSIISSADEYINNEPENFMRYMLGAKYVMTDTYHGTIFSANFRKQFVVINRGKIKVNEFLERNRLVNRLVDELADPTKILSEHLDYQQIDGNIQSYKDSSIEFLTLNLKGTSWNQKF